MNQTDLEDRLRNAYRARADLVTADALIREPPAPGDRTRRPFVAPLLAAAAVVLLAITAVVIAHFANKDTPPAKFDLRFTTPDVKIWDGVAPGWTIATWSAKPDSSTLTVYLVDANGARHAVATMHGTPTTVLGDVSADYSHLAFEDVRGGVPSRKITVVDLRDGGTSQFTAPKGELFSSFAAPDGSTVRLSNGGDTAKIVDLNGGVVSTESKSAFDRLLERLPGNATKVAIDGQPGYVDRGPRNITVGLASGQVLTILSLPGHGCGIARPWDKTSLLVACNSGMWQVPLTGSEAVLLAKPTSDTSVGWGRLQLDRPYRLWDIGRLGGQLYGYEVPSCGANAIVRIGADKVPHRISSDEVGGKPISGAFGGISGDTIRYLAAGSGCKGNIAGTLYSYDPARSKVTALLGSPMTGGGFVRAAIPVARPGPWGRNWLPGG